MPADILHWIAAVVRQRFQRFVLLRNDSDGVTSYWLLVVDHPAQTTHEKLHFRGARYRGTPPQRGT